MTRNTAVSIPDAGAREMTGPFCQSAAVCPFVDLGRQADGRDLECPQVSAGVVEIAGERQYSRRPGQNCPHFLCPITG